MIDRTTHCRSRGNAQLLGISRGRRCTTCPSRSSPSRSGADAPDRRAAPGAPVRRQRGCCAICCSREGIQVGRRHVATLMRRMGIEALYRKPSTSKRHPAHRSIPYLLRNLAIDRPNQVWAMDITYIPMARGFVYLVAVMDWHSRRVLAWRLSNTLEPTSASRRCEEAMARYGKPEIFNTDQGSQFTSAEFTGAADRQRHPDQHGRQGLLARQRVRRAAVAKRQVRGGLLARLRLRQRCKTRLAPLFPVLQSGAHIPRLTAKHPIRSIMII